MSVARKLIALLTALSVVTLVCVGSCAYRRRQAMRRDLEKADARQYEVSRPPLRFVFPTDQTNLADTTSSTVYMPTASGRVESALYGSTRTRGESDNFAARFHKGIDIAPTRRGRDGRALDEVRAVADGIVAYINNNPGGSTYGRYVVLTHEDPLGRIYSLYAHLDAVAPGLDHGGQVAAGETLGRMGNSATYRIPVTRSHLHLEIGVILNNGFEDWFRSVGNVPVHGRYNGLNLFGIDPLRVLLERDADEKRSLLDALQEEPPAFVLALSVRKRPDYYERYPDLWEAAQPPGTVWMDVSEGGVPLRTRAPGTTAADLAAMPAVVSVDTEVLGRNGRALVRQRRDKWELTPAGHRWLEHLLFF